MIIELEDFLTKEEISLAFSLENAAAIEEKITRPQIKRINETIGQENDPLYMAYLVEFLIAQRRDLK